MEKEYKYPMWANIVFAIIFIITGLETTIGLLAWVLVFTLTKKHFTRQALLIKVNPLYPFFIVMFSVLPGYCAWYIFYRLKSKRLNI